MDDSGQMAIDSVFSGGFGMRKVEFDLQDRAEPKIKK
jgi:hypothetical protein